ncbi:NTP pyrophosphatase, house-cleaning of non-canonical NTPs [Arachidicoccus rhizosphaerae]|uniref:NTP pyrophosphatase, house-cleaning of non-canonical NTPs n=1 Tax=Arachidicoccus rhizosphaerae TaxID=551991 RepID=A0A1H3WUW1_9BACT|nr:nucleotide pyrophosphohydrolase [Arachidicoccus rhizosphaerae]SDZ90945.1 NTP pyrophosphatase, house-cleaning of non-canonical NTPs [Arachidicoccus rhizosphaerae]
MKQTEALIAKIKQFRDARDWKQFHNAKDLSMALSIEASELLELFLWKDAQSADPNKIKEELADVLIYAFLLMDNQGLDLTEIIESKLRQNEQKYPVEKAKGSAKKYNEL